MMITSLSVTWSGEFLVFARQSEDHTFVFIPLYIGLHFSLWKMHMVIFQGNYCKNYWRYEGQGWSWWIISIRCYVGCSRCSWKVQAAWYHSSTHKVASYRWKQVLLINTAALNSRKTVQLLWWKVLLNCCNGDMIVSLRSTDVSVSSLLILWAKLWEQVNQCTRCFLVERRPLVQEHSLLLELLLDQEWKSVVLVSYIQNK